MQIELFDYQKEGIEMICNTKYFSRTRIVVVAFFVLTVVTKSHELFEWSEFTVNIGLIICLVVLTYFMLGGK